MAVTHVDGDRYRIEVRGHEVFVDQPTELRGADSAPTPTELFVAGLGACVAFYAGRFLARHGLPREGLTVDTSYQLAGDRPARVREITVSITPPAELPAERREGLLAVASSCLVHESLHQPPEVRIDLAAAADQAPVPPA